MPLGFVDLKDLLDLKVEAVVDLRKPVLNVLVDGRFTAARTVVRFSMM